MKAAHTPIAVVAVLAAGLVACSPRADSTTGEIAEAEESLPLPPLADDTIPTGAATDPFKAPPAAAPPAGATATPLSQLPAAGS